MWVFDEVHGFGKCAFSSKVATANCANAFENVAVVIFSDGDFSGNTLRNNYDFCSVSSYVKEDILYIFI